METGVDAGHADTLQILIGNDRRGLAIIADFRSHGSMGKPLAVVGRRVHHWLRQWAFKLTILRPAARPTE